MKACVFWGSLRHWAEVSLLGLSLCACGPELDLGSDVLWATDHETGDLSGWYAAPLGGIQPDTSMSPVEIAAGPAHSGRYSLKLTDVAQDDMIGPGVYRELVAPPDAYYSVWYYIPRPYQTKSQWTIMKFRARSDSDPTVISHGHDLNLRTLPGGQVILYVYSHDPTYLQAPLADPPAIVPVETWFQIEALYRPRTDETGKLLVWLNGRLVYDLENRRTAGSDDVLWTPCNIGEDVEPLGSPSDEPGAGGAGGAGGEAGAPSTGGASARVPPELYVDDAAISLKRVTPAGKIFAGR
jgi:polysaccharide lyase-like protein